ncbi:FxSxx-COOH cyclophane-containing RiPP peptide [Kitasatospora sp. MAP5-34]|uniref:FxSxx-COOH cyclophane-containing RiPP peptide n=1 Tax=Kitasatospora sp. MAP5-34 TaxID=3035102 RepID=UPI002472F396|nr:FxSxx-COOH cyclophane-containing RiPP peptide [Kitasatospora sp. MAP5-34]MDH6577610.1 FXSXX-COOH protein [Kitasatospora sp. MAP5-34]
MVAALATRPTGTDTELGEGLPPRASLAALAALGTDTLTAQLHRALPGGESGQVAVAAFNSSI